MVTERNPATRPGRALPECPGAFRRTASEKASLQIWPGEAAAAEGLDVYIQPGPGSAAPGRSPALPDIHLTWMKGDKLYAGSGSWFNHLPLCSPLRWGSARTPEGDCSQGAGLELPASAQARPNTLIHRPGGWWDRGGRDRGAGAARAPRRAAGPHC